MALRDTHRNVLHSQGAVMWVRMKWGGWEEEGGGAGKGRGGAAGSAFKELQFASDSLPEIKVTNCLFKTDSDRVPLT